MYFRKDLGRVKCPTLVMGGGLDPVMPMRSSETIAPSLPPQLVRRKSFTAERNPAPAAPRACDTSLANPPHPPYVSAADGCESGFAAFGHPATA